MKFDVVIIDSGVGGLSLLPSFFKTLPFKKYAYFADTKFLPYGNKSRQELLDITKNNVRFVIKKYSPKIIVFGCNTIGTTIFFDVCKCFPDQAFFTIKPNVSVQLDNNKKALLLGTMQTINNIKKYTSLNPNIILCKMPLLANKVEDYLQNNTNFVPYLKRKFKKYQDIDYVILGCTHYYFAKPFIKNFYPNAIICDGCNILTNQILEYLKNTFVLKNNYKLNKKQIKKIKIKLYITNHSLYLKKVYKKIVNNMKSCQYNF